MARKQLVDGIAAQTAFATFFDHNGQKAISAYWGRRPYPDEPVLPPLWSFQFYITFGPVADSDLILPRQLLEKAMRPGTDNDLVPLRLDINFLPGAVPVECMEHYRAEKAARLAAGTRLLLTDPYEEYSKFSFLFIIEHAEWETMGATTVLFDNLDLDDPDDSDQRREVQIERNVKWTGDMQDASRKPFLGETIRSLRMTPAWDGGEEKYSQKLAEGRSDWN